MFSLSSSDLLPQPISITPYVHRGRIVKGIGYVSRRNGVQWYLQRIQWQQKDGRWRTAGWKWSECEVSWLPLLRWSWIDNGSLDRGIEHAAGGCLPEELLLLFVEQLCRPDLDFAAPEALGTFAVVCRTWFKKCAPRLYHSLAVDVDRIDELCRCLQSPHSHLPAHVQRLSIRGGRSWLTPTVAKLLQLLLHLTTVEFSEPLDGHDQVALLPHVSHYLQSRITQGVYASLSRRSPSIIDNLWFHDCSFTSPDDLFRVFGCFPAARTVYLYYVSFAKPASHPVVRHRSSQVVVVLAQGLHYVWSIPYTWTWPHPSTDPSAPGFPGIAATDACTLSYILRSVNHQTMWSAARLCSSCHPEACGCYVCP